MQYEPANETSLYMGNQEVQEDCRWLLHGGEKQLKMSKDVPESHGSQPNPADDQVTEPSASGVFCNRILNMVNSEDVNAIILAQRHMLDRFEKTNEMLLNFNSLSSTRLQQMSDRFMHHTRTLVEMKKDLDIIFRRIRMLKGKLAKQYPESFSNVHESPSLEDDDDFDPIPKSTATTIATSEQSTEYCDTSPSIISPTISQDFEDLSQAPSETPSANGQLLTDDEVAHED